MAFIEVKVRVIGSHMPPVSPFCADRRPCHPMIRSTAAPD